MELFCEKQRVYNFGKIKVAFILDAFKISYQLIHAINPRILKLRAFGT
jgi:hypothetical protein